MLCNTKLIFILRIEFSFHFVSFVFRFLESETSLNYSTFNQLDFVKTAKILTVMT